MVNRIFGVGAVVWACLSGCATTRSATGPFPARETLEAIADLAPPLKTFASDEVVVDRWELSGPFPEVAQVLAHLGATPWDGLLASHVAARPGVLIATQDQTCAAREVGRFLLAHKGQPSTELWKFMLGRCGSTVSHQALHFLHGTAPKSLSDQALFDQWRGAFEKLLEANLAPGPRAAGVWFGRSAERAVAVVVSGQRHAQLAPVSLVPNDNGEIVVTGDLFAPAERVQVLVNQGRYGYAECDPEPGRYFRTLLFGAPPCVRI